ncbi:hypothetical protein ACM66B_003183 [Microbotryomycetes sp. NB124-2]
MHPSSLSRGTPFNAVHNNNNNNNDAFIVHHNNIDTSSSIYNHIVDLTPHYTASVYVPDVENHNALFRVHAPTTTTATKPGASSRSSPSKHASTKHATSSQPNNSTSAPKKRVSKAKQSTTAQPPSISNAAPGPAADSSTTAANDNGQPLFLAPEYTHNPAGPASSETTSFRCAHCDKVYQGKHARSIWRRHLQDKHGIPLSQQPRRTRWDNDASKVKTEEERHSSVLNSKRQWARKSRAAKRAEKSASVDLESTAGTPAPDDDDDKSRAAGSAAAAKWNADAAAAGDVEEDDDGAVEGDDSDYDESGKGKRRAAAGRTRGAAAATVQPQSQSAPHSRTTSSRSAHHRSSLAEPVVAHTAPLANSIYNRRLREYDHPAIAGPSRERASSHQPTFASSLDHAYPQAERVGNAYSQPRGPLVYATHPQAPTGYYQDPYAVPHYVSHSWAAPLSAPLYPPPPEAEYYRHAHEPTAADPRYASLARPSSTPATITNPFTSHPGQAAVVAQPSNLTYFDRRQASPISHSRSQSGSRELRSPVRAQFLTTAGLSTVGGGGGKTYERAEDAANALIAMKVASPASSISHARTTREDDEDDDDEVNGQLGLSGRTSTQDEDDEDEDETGKRSPGSESSDLSASANRPWPADFQGGVAPTPDRGSSVSNVLSPAVGTSALVGASSSVSPRKRAASDSPDSATRATANTLLASARKIRASEAMRVGGPSSSSMTFAQHANLTATPTPGNQLGGVVGMSSSPALGLHRDDDDDDDEEGDLTARGESALDDGEMDDDTERDRRAKRRGVGSKRRSSAADASPSRQYGVGRKQQSSSSSSGGRTRHGGGGAGGSGDLLSSSAASSRYLPTTTSQGSGSASSARRIEPIALHHHHPVGLSSDLGGFNIDSSSSSSSAMHHHHHHRRSDEDHSGGGHPSSTELMPPPHPSSSILSTPAPAASSAPSVTTGYHGHFGAMKGLMLAQGMSRSASNPIPFGFSNSSNTNSNNGFNFISTSSSTSNYPNVTNPISSPPSVNYMFSSPAHPGISKQLGLTSQPGPGFLGAALNNVVGGSMLSDDVQAASTTKSQDVPVARTTTTGPTNGFSQTGTPKPSTFPSSSMMSTPNLVGGGGGGGGEGTVGKLTTMTGTTTGGTRRRRRWSIGTTTSNLHSEGLEEP